MEFQLILPMAAYVFFMIFLGVKNFFKRTGAVKSKAVHYKYFETFQGYECPENIIVWGRHYDNQFQLPMLFFITCTVFLAVNKIDYSVITLAWLFVITRFGHSWVHLGSNKVLRRAKFFALGWLVIILMWVYILFLYLK